MSEPFSYNVDSMILKLPILGSVNRKINLARFTHFFSVVFNSGIGILESLQASKNVVSNRVLRESIDTMTRSVSEGMSLTASMRISSQFPSRVVRMFKIGEDSGNMTESLENINFFYERGNKRRGRERRGDDSASAHHRYGRIDILGYSGGIPDLSTNPSAK